MRKTLKSIYRFTPFKKTFFLLLKTIWTPPESLYRHFYFRSAFTVNVDRGIRFRIRHYGYQIENEIFWKGLTGGWEKISMKMWIALAKRSAVIFDVGANTGVYALTAKAVNPHAIVHAFEPVHRVFLKLAENVRLNGFEIICHEAAASNQDGLATIYDTGDEHILSVTVNRNTASPQTTTTAVTVKTTRLSSVLEQGGLGAVDLMKIDVETHEAEVLEGLEPFLSRHRPTLLIEVLNDDIATRIGDIVRGMDYLYFNIDEQNGIRQTDSILQSDHYNYLLCQPATAHALGLLPVAAIKKN